MKINNINFKNIRHIKNNNYNKMHENALKLQVKDKILINSQDNKNYINKLKELQENRVKVVFIYDPDGRDYLNNLTLIGSWDKTGHYTNRWEDSKTPMIKGKDGKWYAVLNLVNDKEHKWQWGVLADGPSGKAKWAIFKQGNLEFTLSPKNKPRLVERVDFAYEPVKVVEYKPTTFRQMGNFHKGNDLYFKVWAPDAKDIKVKIEKDGKDFIYQLKKGKDGFWQTEIKDKWSEFENCPYTYLIKTPEGEILQKSDPYARDYEGPQRGIDLLYLSKKDGKQVHQYYPKSQWVKLARFEVQGHEDADSVYLVLSDKNGKILNKEDLQNLLGDFNSDIVRKFHNNKFSDFYIDNIDSDGKIKLVKQGGAWACILNNPDKLVGLKYRFLVYNKDKKGKLYLVGDKNKDGILQDDEAKATAFNDNYELEINKNFLSERKSIITDAHYDFKYDKVERMAKDKNKMVIYQLHVGSIFSQAGNVKRSTFKDLIKNLKYFKELGVNTLELLPTNAFSGVRDWGYTGCFSFAQSNAYGFEDENGNFVSGTKALKMFIDLAHSMGFRVLNDVVYNHVGGDYNNLWNFDGKNNPYFNWNTNPNYPSQQYVNTPWGSMPAFSREQVKRFYVDNALYQLDELHFDGLRFDFTGPIKEHKEGMRLLQEINKQIHFYRPDAITSAEQFPYDPSMTEPVTPDGYNGGFDNAWNTEFNHRLAHSNDGNSILQQAAHNKWTNIDYFMDELINHPGFSSFTHSVTIITDHDEIGNAERIIQAASGDKKTISPTQWARNAVRFTFSIGMLSPGMPLFFQGTESLANNEFKWGISSTWDIGWQWREIGKNLNFDDIRFTDKDINLYKQLVNLSDKERKESKIYKSLNSTNKAIVNYLVEHKDNLDESIYNIERKLHFNFSKDVIHLRTSTQAFDADAKVKRVYTHNDNSVLAFEREKDGDKYLVIGSLNHKDLRNYNIPIEEGKWELVLDSDLYRYGGNNIGADRKIVLGGKQALFDLPKGGVLVYKKIE